MMSVVAAANFGYGYEEATPTPKTSSKHIISMPSAVDLGYGDDEEIAAMPSAADLGYGDDEETTVPEEATPSVPSAVDLGYGEEEVIVSMPSAVDLGYGDDEATVSPMPSAIDLGYGEEEEEVTVPMPSAVDLGYGAEEEPVRAPTTTTTAAAAAKRSTRSPRRKERGLRRTGGRSSIGGIVADSGISNGRAKRRVTMDHLLAGPDQLSRPSHHTMAPRRSSLAPFKSFDSVYSKRQTDELTTNVNANATFTTTTFAQKARRRVSFGGSDAVSHVPKLHTTEQDKKDMWYNKSELRKLQRNLKKIVTQEVKLDETTDCWRGLETFVKQHEAMTNTCNSIMRTRTSESHPPTTAEATCNQIILQLQQQLQQQKALTKDSHISKEEDQTLTNSTDDDDNAPFLDDRQARDLQSSAQRLLRRATRTGNKKAAEDALEAHAIYMETMDSDQVTSCFRLKSARGA